jgi:hypothetical protein
MAGKRGKRGTSRGVRMNPRIVSRPAVLPTQKDSTTRTLLSGLDTLGEVLLKHSEGRSTWKLKDGSPQTVWVVHFKQLGDWDWRAIHLAFVKVETMKSIYKAISDRRLSFARLHYNQFDDDGELVTEGWYAPSPLTTWENLVKALQEESNEDDPGSRARRYENTHIDQIVISLASRANTSFDFSRRKP